MTKKITATPGNPVNDTTISSGYLLTVEQNASATGNIILAGGEIFVAGPAKSGSASAGIASATVLDGGTAFITGTGIGTRVNSGGMENVIGVSSGSIIGSSGMQLVGGGETQGTRVREGGIQTVNAGVVHNTTVDGGGIELLVAGKAIGLHLQSGGLAIVSSSSVASNSLVGSGATLLVLPGGSLAGYVKGNGDVVSTGVALINSATAGAVNQGARANHTKVGSQEEQFVLRHGVADNTVVSATDLQANAIMTVFGEAERGVIGGGGVAQIMAGGEIENALVKQDGVVFVLNHGIAENTQVSGTSSSAYAALTVAGRSIGTILSNFGVENVDGKTSGTIVDDGGIQNLFDRGNASATTVNAGGQQVLESAVSKASLLKGGVETVGYNSTASGTVINSGGVLSITQAYPSEISGKAFGSIVNNGGSEILAGGKATGTKIHTGGLEVVSGGTERNAVIAGGTLEITGSGTATSRVIFGGGNGDFRIGTAAMPSALITGFTASDEIEIAVPYLATDTVAVLANNFVTISAGGTPYVLHVAGARKGEADFTLGGDSFGTVLARNAAAGPITGAAAASAGLLTLPGAAVPDHPADTTIPGTSFHTVEAPAFAGAGFGPAVLQPMPVNASQIIVSHSIVS